MKENTTSILEELGWDSHFAEEFQELAQPDVIAARVINQSKHAYRVHSEHGDLPASLAGKILHNIETGDSRPAVGDWVVIKLDSTGQRAVIKSVLSRKSRFSRKVPGSRTEEQVVAANIDMAFIVSGLDGGRNLNLRRIERYLTLSWDSGASPIIVLNKADLCTDIPAHINDIEHAMWGVPIHVTSATEEWGIDLLKKHFVRGTTAAFLGASGVGKTSIINVLLGEKRLEVGDVREQDRRGRHTTSHRELFLLPGGGAVIDTPGIREIQLWADEDALFSAFPDIEQLSSECRFSDCTHTSEPGCAIREAIEEGTLDVDRFQSYSKLRKEIHYLETHREQKARLEEKAKWKKISKWSKEIKKMRPKP